VFHGVCTLGKPVSARPLVKRIQPWPAPSLKQAFRLQSTRPFSWRIQYMPPTSAAVLLNSGSVLTTTCRLSRLQVCLRITRQTCAAHLAQILG